MTTSQARPSDRGHRPSARFPALLGRLVGLRGRLLSTLLVSVVASVSLAAVGVQQVARQSEQTRAAYTTGTVPLDALRTLQGTWWEYQAHSAAARAQDAGADEVAAEQLIADRLRDVIAGQEEVVRTSGLSVPALAPFEEFVDSSREYLDSDASHRGEIGVALSTEELAGGRQAAQVASDALARSTALQVRAAADTSLQARADFVSARRKTLTLLLAGLIATLLVSAAGMASVMRPLAQLRRSMSGARVPGARPARTTEDLLRGLAEDIATVQHSRELVRRTVEALPSPVLRVDGAGRVLFANSRARDLLQVDEGADPRHQAAVMSAGDVEPYLTALAAAVSGDDTLPRRLRVVVEAHGATRHLTAVFVPLGDLDGTHGATVSFSDDTEAVLRHEALRRQAETDVLTGSLNRSALVELLDRSLDERADLSVVFVDVDRFKPINDTFGHATGDAVLRAVVAAISRTLRPGDVVGRVGGDEFVVLLQGRLHDADRAAVVRRMRTAIERPLDAGGTELVVGVSMGAVAARAGESADAVLARADTAMYLDKRSRAAVGASR